MELAVSRNTEYMRALGAKGGKARSSAAKLENLLVNREWMLSGLPSTEAIAAHEGRWIIRDGAGLLSICDTHEVERRRLSLDASEVTHWPIDGHGNKVKYPRDGSRRL